MPTRKCIILLWLVILAGLVAGCSNDSGSNNESLRIYEMAVAKGSFTTVAGDATGTKFELNLSEVPDEVLYFTNRGALVGGYDTTDNVMNRVWPRVYGTVAPNAIMKATTANQGTIQLFCVLDKQTYNRETGKLVFTITYLDGQRPGSNQALTDVKIIITNNVATVLPEVWSHLLAGDVGTFEPTATEGTYIFRMQKTDTKAFGVACAPQRKSESITVSRYIQSWQTRFGTNPPNATIAYSPDNDQTGGVQVVTLTNPVYDEKTGSISFTAKSLYSAFLPIGKTGLTVKKPSLFIDGGASGFPTYKDNVFSIQYRNSTDSAIIVWFDGTQPPCSQAMSAKCVVTGAPSSYSAQWEKLSTDKIFEQSGTYLYITEADNKTTTKQEKILNHIDLKLGQTLRLIPPVVDGYPQWYFNNGKTAGVAAWVTKTSVSMPAVMKVTKFEYNLTPDHKIWPDMSGVDGINTAATMMLEGPGCGTDVNCGTGTTLPKGCKINLDAWVFDVAKGTSNDGCPYIMKTGDANSCPNPNQYPLTGDINADNLYPKWVVAQDKLTTAFVEQLYFNEYGAAEIEWIYKLQDIQGYAFSGRAMASAPVPIENPNNKLAIKNLKIAYHIWWATNPAGQGWLKFLQQNANGRCDQYGWAFDERRWQPGDTFNDDGNPPANSAVKPLWNANMKKDTYLNIDILQVM